MINVTNPCELQKNTPQSHLECAETVDVKR